MKTDTKNSKYRELENRTENFAKDVINFCLNLKKGTINNELIKQIIRSGGSIGANYREANESLGKKDFKYRIRVSRKEAKETSYWLELIRKANPNESKTIDKLSKEVFELRNIFSAILNKAENKKLD